MQLPLTVQFGREICSDLANAEQREWLITNGIGGYGCGTIAGLLSRHYHGLLVAALKPPLGRTLLVAKLDEILTLAPLRPDGSNTTYDLATNRWADGAIQPQGYLNIERFRLEGTTPVWTFACADALLEKRIWMQPGQNTTYVQYHLLRGQQPVELTCKALINYRDHHGCSQAEGNPFQLGVLPDGICVIPRAETDPEDAGANSVASAVRLYLRSDRATVQIVGEWYRNYELAIERYRGIPSTADHYHAATFTQTLAVGEPLTLVASTETNLALDGTAAWQQRYCYEQDLLERWQQQTPQQHNPPIWQQQLVLAADQFIVDRRLPGPTNLANVGKTIIAGYPWFGDWGRDTMISLPGLTIATGRADLARPILQTFAQYLDQGMLPNVFPEAGTAPAYNTVDAIFWFFEAVYSYITATQDQALLAEIFPALEDVIRWHQNGTRYGIHLDPQDGLIYAGEPGVQLTWMDAKLDAWVVTPRVGKPVEINALWYNALQIMVDFAQRLGRSPQVYQALAAQTHQGFQRFWDSDLGYCYDVLDTPTGYDPTLRPNQLFAIAWPQRLNQASAQQHPSSQPQPLLSPAQQKAVVDVCARELLTAYGLRSLDPEHPNYQGHYGGDRWQRDGSYHQGTAWGWLLGVFVQSHWQVYQDGAAVQHFLAPMADHLQAGCVGTVSEIFDGDRPFVPRGAFAQAWSVAELLRLQHAIALATPAVR